MTKIYSRILIVMSKGVGSIFLLFLLLAFSYIQGQDIDQSYSVYSDQWDHGLPTGFMGAANGKSIALNDVFTENPYHGNRCIKMVVSPNIEGWRGLHIQMKGWNISLDQHTVLPDLSEYDQLEFYAKAIPAEGQEVFLIQEIGVGQMDKVEEAMFTDSYLEIGEDWKKYTIKLKKGELKRVNTLLFFTLPEGTLFLDEIKFTKKKK
jgi:hypothetical protein